MFFFIVKSNAYHIRLRYRQEGIDSAQKSSKSLALMYHWRVTSLRMITQIHDSKCGAVNVKSSCAAAAAATAAAALLLAAAGVLALLQQVLLLVATALAVAERISLVATDSLLP
jgi:hypothetical protein